MRQQASLTKNSFLRFSTEKPTDKEWQDDLCVLLLSCLEPYDRLVDRLSLEQIKSIREEYAELVESWKEAIQITKVENDGADEREENRPCISTWHYNCGNRSWRERGMEREKSREGDYNLLASFRRLLLQTKLISTFRRSWLKQPTGLYKIFHPLGMKKGLFWRFQPCHHSTGTIPQ